MSVASESVSHSTLLTAFSKVDLQSDNLEAQGSDTPFPSERLSDETIKTNHQTQIMHQTRQMHLLPTEKSVKYSAKSHTKLPKFEKVPEHITCELSDIIYLITC